MNGSRYIEDTAKQKNPISSITPGLKNKSKGRINERSHSHKGTNDVSEVQLSHE